MTKDLALLVGADQKWLSTQGFLDKVDANLKKAMGVDVGVRPSGSDPSAQRWWSHGIRRGTSDSALPLDN